MPIEIYSSKFIVITYIMNILNDLLAISIGKQLVKININIKTINILLILGGNMLNQKAGFEFVPINKVMPNPKNARKDPSVKTEDMQATLREKGWQEALPAYKNGVFYVLISGHRRWYAAKELGMTEIPVFVVEKPTDSEEEMERIGSVQSGQVDWNQFEWAEYTYNMFKSTPDATHTMIAKKFNVSPFTVQSRVRVYEYYEKDEIESGLIANIFSISTLEYVRQWINKLKKYQPELYSNFGDQLIRQIMLKKLDNQCFSSDIFNDDFVTMAPTQYIEEFLMDPLLSLTDIKRKFSKEQNMETRIRNIKHNKRRMKAATKDINGIKYRTKKEAKQIKSELDYLKEEISKKMEELKREKEDFSKRQLQEENV